MAHITHAVESIAIINLFANFIRAVRFYKWKAKINKMSFEERVTGLEIQYYKQVMESKYNE